MQTVKVKVQGQYYWQDGRVKQISAFGYDKPVIVEVPVNQLHAPLQWIQRVGINDVLKKRNTKATRFRTCEIVGEIPKVQQAYQPITSDQTLPIETVAPPITPGGSTIPAGPQVVEEPSNEPSEFPTSSSEVDNDEDSKPISQSVENKNKGQSTRRAKK